MIKRVLSILLAVSMVFSVMYASAAEGKTAQINKNAINLLERLGIIFPKTDEVYNAEISRADFAVYAARTLGYDDNTDPGETRYFVDMAMYDYAAYSTNCLVEKGALSVGDNRMFRPNEPITYSEAVKIAVCMLGYKPVAEIRGAYPAGYMAVAKNLELLDGISSNASEKFTMNDAIILLFNTLKAPLYEVESVKVSDDGAVMSFRVAPDNTILYECFGYRLVEGILTGFDGLNIAFDVMAAEERAVVNGVVYRVESGLDLENFIGSNICALADKDDKIVYAYQEIKKDKEITIDVRDFVSYDGETLVYSEDNKEKELDVASAYVLYNGAVPESGLRDLFMNLESGSIKVVDYNGDRKNDALIVYDYHAYVFKSADTVKNIIYSKIENQMPLALDDYEKFEITDKSGKVLLLADIEENSVLNVMAATDKSRIVIVVNDDAVSGTVQQIWDRTPFEIKVDGTVYSINKAHGAMGDDIAVGQKATYLLNIFGEIVMITDGVRENFIAGFLCGLGVEGVLNKELKLRVFTKNSGVQALIAADNVRIDGVRCKDALTVASNIPGTFCADGKVATFETQMILFKTNAEGKVSEIDTYNLLDNEDPDLTLTRLTDGKSKLMKYEGRIEKIYPINANTAFYCVPQDGVIGDEGMDYKVVNQAAFNRAVGFEFECYKTKGENEFVDVVLYRMNPANTRDNSFLNSNMFLVGEKIRTIDKDSNVYYTINGLMQGNEHSADVYEDYLVASSLKVDEIEEGDLIRYRKDETGRVIELEMLYDFSTETCNTKASFSPFDVANISANFYLSHGYVKEKGKNILGWCYDLPSSETSAIDEVVDLSTVKFMVYDGAQREGSRLYTAGMDSIADYDTVGEKCDVIIVQFLQTMVRSAVVYKR